MEKSSSGPSASFIKYCVLMRLWIAEERINKTSDSAAQSLNAELQAGREYNMISTLLDIRRFLLEVKVKVKKCSCWKDVLQWSG